MKQFPVSVGAKFRGIRSAVRSVCQGALWALVTVCFLPSSSVAADVTVSNLLDSGAGSLRQAILDVPASGVIDFDPSLEGETISLLSELLVGKAVTIDGEGLASRLSIRGDGTQRLFSVAAAGDLTLRGLFLADGVSIGATRSGYGGAVFSAGTATLDRCFFTENHASNYGGAVHSEGSGTLVITRCTFADNTSDLFGGGVTSSGTTTVGGSTFSGNSAGHIGGGVYGDAGSLLLENSTFTENSSGFYGGGVYSGCPLVLESCTVVGNDGNLSGGGIYNDYRSDLLTNNSVIANNTADLSAQIFGGWQGENNFAFGNPRVGLLGDWGGETKTMPPLPGSPLIDTTGTTALTTDQRGFERVLGDGLDIGAHELPSGDLTMDGLTIYAEVPTAAVTGVPVGTVIRFQVSADREFLANVSTFSGVPDTPGLVDGERSEAQYSYPTGVAQGVDGTLYIADTGNHRIRMMTVEGEVTTIAGSGEGVFGYGFMDGPGAIAKFAFPSAIAVGPAGNLYVADTFNQSIRKLSKPAAPGQPWTVSTLAGSGIAGYVDGTGPSARFDHPQGLVVDGEGVVFVADSGNHRVRRVSSSGAVSTYAGVGSPVVTGCETDGTTTVVCDDTSGISAGVEISGTNIPAGATVAVVTSATSFELSAAATGTGTNLELAVFANGARASATFVSPYALAFNEAATKLYVADRDDNRIRAIELTSGFVSTFAGTGAEGFDDDPVAGPVGSGTFHGPVGLAVDGEDNLFVADELNHAVRKISPAGLVSTVAGLQTQGEEDGNARVARFDGPVALVADRVTVEGSVIVGDSGNHLLRRVSMKPLEVLAVIGDSDPVSGLTEIHAILDFVELGLDPDQMYFTRWVTPAPVVPNMQVNGQSFYLYDRVKVETKEYTNLTATSATLNADVNPSGSSTRVEFHIAENLEMSSPYVLQVFPDIDGDVILPVSAVAPLPQEAGETIYYRAVATNARGSVQGDVLSLTFPVMEVVTNAAADETRTTATLNGMVNAQGSDTTVMFQVSTDGNMGDPWQVATRAGTGVAGSVDSAAPRSSSFDTPAGVAVVGDDVYLADRLNHRIRKVAANGIVSTFAGNGAGFADGVGAAALFDHPEGMAADLAGNLYVADQHNHRIRVISPAGVVSTLAGSSTAGHADGVGAAAQFLFPSGVAVEASGDLLVADTGNHSIRRIAIADGTVTTISGTGEAGSGNGFANLAQFSSPRDITVDVDGTIYISDTGNHVIRKLSVSGLVSTFSGTGEQGFVDGDSGSALFDSPQGIVYSDGGIYVVDQGNNRVRHLDEEGRAITIAGSGIAGAVDSPPTLFHPATAAEFSAPSGIAVDAGGTLWVTEQGNHGLRKIYQIPLVEVSVAGTLSGDSADDVSGVVGDLLAGARYYFRAVGTNDVGSIEGGILSFTTLRNQEIAVFDGSVEVLERQVDPVVIGATPLGLPVTRRLTISNTGEWDLVLGTVAATSGFSVVHTPGVVAPGEDVEVDVILDANVGGEISGTITIPSDDPEVPEFVFSVSGTVYDPPTVVTLEAGHDNGPLLRASVNPQNSTTTVSFEYSTHPYFSGLDVSTIATGLQAGGLAVDGAGNLYVSDTMHHRILKVSPDGTTVVLAGTGDAGFLDGAGESALFNEPIGLAIDAAGTLFVADSKNHRIRAIARDGLVSTFCGLGDADFTDGVASAARFDHPAGLAINDAGVIYVADTGNNRVRTIDTDGTAATLAGPSALSSPVHLVVGDNGTVYLTESSSHQILSVSAGGAVSVLAGGGAGYVDGASGAARFSGPAGVGLDGGGNLFVADAGNHRVRRIALVTGVVDSFAGSGSDVTADGDGETAGIPAPSALVLDADGDVLVGQSIDGAIRRVASTTVTVTMDSTLSGLDDVVVSQAVSGLLDGTTYYYQTRAVNLGGMTVGGPVVPFQTTPFETFADWRSTHFGSDASNPLVAGAMADPSGDGVSNLLKYAQGQDPNVNGRDGSPEVVYSGGLAILTYTKVIGARELSYQPEWSEDMEGWSSTGVEERIISFDTDSQRVEVSIPIGAGPTRFFRVRVIYQ